MLRKYGLIISLLVTFITLLALAIIYPNDFKPVFRLPEIDLIGHYFGFLLLAAFVQLQLRLRLLTCVIGMSCYAGITELVQAYLGFRNGAWDDFIADLLGIASFGLIKVGLIKLRVHFYQKRQPDHTNNKMDTNEQ